MKTLNCEKLAVAILGVGIAAIAAYLNVNGNSTEFLWIGVFFCYINVLS